MMLPGLICLVCKRYATKKEVSARGGLFFIRDVLKSHTVDLRAHRFFYYSRDTYIYPSLAIVAWIYQQVS